MRATRLRSLGCACGLSRSAPVPRAAAVGRGGDGPDDAALVALLCGLPLRCKSSAPCGCCPA
ncbi:hypothetical protein DWUX_495 [Desulfovibrio diazotrophicus]|nr:hypothetical protein DWUX_495 [Desulfovibrio diazotrophicus]VVU42819.1 hypothetical protein DWUX_165 [Desulfovibrio diazotrophicus]